METALPTAYPKELSGSCVSWCLSYFTTLEAADVQTMTCPLDLSWPPHPPFRETGSASICNSIPLLHMHLLF